MKNLENNSAFEKYMLEWEEYKDGKWTANNTLIHKKLSDINDYMDENNITMKDNDYTIKGWRNNKWEILIISKNMTEKEKLIKDIENSIKILDNSRKKLQELEEKERIEKDSVIKKLEEYTTEEKIKFFDNLYKMAKYELNELINNGYSNEDNDHYAWEEYIQILAKDKKSFWKYWNSLSE